MGIGEALLCSATARQSKARWCDGKVRHCLEKAEQGEERRWRSWVESATQSKGEAG